MARKKRMMGNTSAPATVAAKGRRTPVNRHAGRQGTLAEINLQVPPTQIPKEYQKTWRCIHTSRLLNTLPAKLVRSDFLPWIEEDELSLLMKHELCSWFSGEPEANKFACFFITETKIRSGNRPAATRDNYPEKCPNVALHLLKTTYRNWAGHVLGTPKYRSLPSRLVSSPSFVLLITRNTKEELIFLLFLQIAYFQSS